jgi:lipopolysaccharide biosynthesis protein
VKVLRLDDGVDLHESLLHALFLDDGEVIATSADPRKDEGPVIVISAVACLLSENSR